MITSISTAPTNPFYKFKNYLKPSCSLISKTCMVALACLSLFSNQQNQKFVCGFSLFAISATILSEIYLEKNKIIKWLNCNHIHKKKLIRFIMVCNVINFIFGLINRAKNLNSNENIPQESVNNFSDIFFRFCFIYPIQQEIFFRGFLQERIEDMLYLFDKYIKPIKTLNQHTISNLTQAICFGLINSSMYEESQKVACLVLTLHGLHYGHAKNSSKTLITPIILHTAYNLSAFARAQVLEA